MNIFTIDCATVSLYQVREDSATRTHPYGDADTDHPIFVNREAESIRLTSRLEERTIRPTGYRYPVIKHVGEEHEISIERVFLHRTPGDGDTVSEEVEDRRNRFYILRIVWIEPPPKPYEQCAWKARTYYGVTAPNWDLRTDVDVLAFTEAQTLKGAFYKPASGTGEPPANL